MSASFNRPVDPGVILTAVLKSRRMAPKAYNKRDKNMISLCEDDPKWFESEDWYRRMLVLYKRLL